MLSQLILRSVDLVKDSIQKLQSSYNFPQLPYQAILPHLANCFVCVCACVFISLFLSLSLSLSVCVCVCEVFMDASISLRILEIQNFFRPGSYLTKMLFNSSSIFLPFNIRNNITVAMAVFTIFNCEFALWKQIASPSRYKNIASSKNTFCQ